MSNTFYGREKEIAWLRGMFDQCAGNGVQQARNSADVALAGEEQGMRAAASSGAPLLVHSLRRIDPRGSRQGRLLSRRGEAV